MAADTTKFNMVRDINGFNGFGVPQSNNIISGALAANTEQHITVPSDHAYYLAVFYYSAGATVYVSNTATAAVPAGSLSATAQVAINPAAFLVKGASTLSFITADSGGDIISIAYYSLPYYGSSSI